MSAYLLGLGFRADMGTCQRKLVLLKLIDACEEDGTRIFPAVATVARAAQCSTRQVQRELKAFQEAGLLTLVREGRGRGITSEYAMDLNVLTRIAETGWDAYHNRCAGAAAGDEKGDGESPFFEQGSEAEKVTGETGKGDSGDKKGDSRSHPTPYTPPLDPSSQSARARDGGAGAPGEREGFAKGGERQSGDRDEKPTGGEESSSDRGGENPLDPKARERAFKRFAPQWPTWLSSSEPAARKAWEKLGEAECAEAEARAADYAAAVKAEGKKYLCSLQVYLAEKRWERLGEAVPPPEQPLVLKPYGKDWMAWRLMLLDERAKRPWRPTAFQRNMIDSGNGAMVEADRRRAEHPEVAELDAAAQSGRSMTLPRNPFGATGQEKFVQIARGTAEWDAWEAWHAERDWPWIDPPAHVRFVWVPAARPEKWQRREKAENEEAVA